MRLLSVSLVLAVRLWAESVPQSTEPTLLERAFVLDEGKERPRDATAAAALYQLAANSGDAFAHLRLGYLAETGDGVPQDYAVARMHYEAAVAAGLSEARLRLAICHLEGWGGPVDRPAFAREIRSAAEADYFPAQNILATMYFIGFAVPEDRAEGVKWLERAAAADHAVAQYRLGEHLADVSRLALGADIKLARTWYQLSAEQEYRAAMRGMARTFLVGARSNRNWELGQKWLTLATESGDADAPFILAVCEMLHVDAPQHDAEKARGWLELASARGNYRAAEIILAVSRGRELSEAIKYVLNVPFDDRYVQNVAATVPDTPTRQPVVFRIVRPIYPQSLVFTGTAGKVVVDFLVDTTGRVTNAKAIESPHPLFAERAVEAVNQWRFHPGRRNGRLVVTHMQVPVIFTLDDTEMQGVDGLLRHALDLAERLGPKVAADAADLRVAMPTSKLPIPRMPDGSAVATDAAALILLVLDKSGHPLRGHVLQARPESIGLSLLTEALAHDYEPRVIGGEAVPSSVVLPFYIPRGREPVLQTH